MEQQIKNENNGSRVYHRIIQHLRTMSPHKIQGDVVATFIEGKGWL